jgi:hypothetical protein
MNCKIADESLPRFESWTCHLFAQVRPVRGPGPADVRERCPHRGQPALTRYPACHHQQDAGDQPGCKDAPPGLPLPEAGSREDQEAVPDTCQNLPAPALDHRLILGGRVASSIQRLASLPLVGDSHGVDRRRTSRCRRDS